MPLTMPFDGLVDRGVVEDDVRCLAAELERQLLARSCHPALDRLADLGRAGERDLVDVRVDERRTRATVTGDDVDDARRQLCLPKHVAEEERRQRRRLGRLQHDRVAGSKRGRDLPGEHQEREVPRDDLAADAERRRRAIRERVLELVRPARVVEEVRRCERQVDVARLLDRLAAVQAFQHRELTRALGEDACDPEQVLRALRGRDSLDQLLNASCAAATAAPHVGLGCLADLGQRRFVARRNRREVLLRPTHSPPMKKP